MSLTIGRPPSSHITQGDRSVAVHQNVINSVIATGDSQIFIGDYVRLNDACIQPLQIFNRVELDNFIGRDWIVKEIDTFLNKNDRGYFILEGDAGVGKTTFLAWLVKQRSYLHHFIELAPGMEGIGIGLKNLSAQLILKYKISDWYVGNALPQTATRPDFLYGLLNLASEQIQDGEKVVLVVDALEEAGTPSGHNVLGLPATLPKGVYFIVSKRPVAVTLNLNKANTGCKMFVLTAEGEENLNDMRFYISKAVHWSGISKAIIEANCDPQMLIDALMSKCQGLWIYLYYVIHEIEYGKRTPLSLEDLPNGITQYYAIYWNRWRKKNEEEWNDLYLPILSTLAISEAPLTLEMLIQWLAIDNHRTKIQSLLDEDWRIFIIIDASGNETKYRFYHASLRQFFLGQIYDSEIGQEEHSLIKELESTASRMQKNVVLHYTHIWGGLDCNLSKLNNPELRRIDDYYPFNHICAHLIQAGFVQEFHKLLCLEQKYTFVEKFRILKSKRKLLEKGRRNLWYVLHQEENKIQNYLIDLHRASVFANERQDDGMSIRYSLMTTSLNSLAEKLPPQLLGGLVKYGMWTSEQAVTYVSLIPNHQEREKNLAILAPYIAQLGSIDMALTVARQMKLNPIKIQTLSELVPHLSGEQYTAVFSEVFSSIGLIKNDYDKEKILSILFASRIPLNLLSQAFEFITQIKNHQSQLNLLEILCYQLTPTLLSEAITLIENIEYMPDRVRAFSILFSYLDDYKREDILFEILDTAHQIDDIEERIQALISLARSFAKCGYIENAFGILQQIKEYFIEFRRNGDEQIINSDENLLLEALLTIAPYLPLTERSKLFLEAHEVINKNKQAFIRAKALAIIASISERQQQKLICDRALKQIGIIIDIKQKLEILNDLFPLLTAKQLKHALDMGKKAICDFEKVSERIEGFFILAPYLTDSECKRILLQILGEVTINDQPQLTQTMVAIIPYLDQFFYRQIISARGVANLKIRSLALAASINLIAPQFPIITKRILFSPKLLFTPRQEDVLSEILDNILLISDDEEKIATLDAISPYLIPTLQKKLSFANFSIDPLENYGCVGDLRLLTASVTLASLALFSERRSKEAFSSSIEIALDINDTRYKKKIFGFIVSIMPKELLDKELENATDNLWIGETKLLFALLPNVTMIDRDRVVSKALNIGKQLSLPEEKVNLITVLIPYMTNKDRDEIYSEMICDLSGTNMLANFLASFFPYLGDADKNVILQRILELVDCMESKHNPTKSLMVLLPFLSGTAKRQVIEIALEKAMQIIPEQRQIIEMASLLPYLSASGREKNVSEMLLRLQGVMSIPERIEALINLIPFISETQRRQAISGIFDNFKERSSIGEHAKALSNLIPYLSNDEYEEIIFSVLPTEQNEISDNLLDFYITWFSKFHHPKEFRPTWQKILIELQWRTRESFCMNFDRLIPMLHALGGKNALLETYQAISDVGCWWL
jgi:hypothetical protein